jgi:hypothetical protein
MKNIHTHRTGGFEFWNFFDSLPAAFFRKLSFSRE